MSDNTAGCQRVVTPSARYVRLTFSMSGNTAGVACTLTLPVFKASTAGLPSPTSACRPFASTTDGHIPIDRGQQWAAAAGPQVRAACDFRGTYPDEGVGCRWRRVPSPDETVFRYDTHILHFLSASALVVVTSRLASPSLCTSYPPHLHRLFTVAISVRGLYFMSWSIFAFVRLERVATARAARGSKRAPSMCTGRSRVPGGFTLDTVTLPPCSIFHARLSPHSCAILPHMCSGVRPSFVELETRNAPARCTTHDAGRAGRRRNGEEGGRKHPSGSTYGYTELLCLRGLTSFGFDLEGRARRHRALLFLCMFQSVGSLSKREESMPGQRVSIPRDSGRAKSTSRLPVTV
ncbi:hypothetical protein B0H14DRAFT_3495670 [Mycena olivaceomarginata]|nr:hypothetical protein B0H14DRAFT_3495670 [Mycena olivaceomarginata]